MGGARRDLTIGGLLTVLGIGVCAEAVRLHVGSALDPQPGFFPLVGGLLLIALSTLQIGLALRAVKANGDANAGRLAPPARDERRGFGGHVGAPWSPPDQRSATAPPARDERGGFGGHVGAPMSLVGGLVVYVGFLPWLGYPLATTLLAVLALRVQATRWRSAIAAALLLSLGSYFLFAQLGVPLPGGRLFGG